MAYDRFDTRRGWREPRSRWSGTDADGRNFGERSWDRDDVDRNDRGFFERAGDEVASWFGDDEAERRRREDARRYGDEDSLRRPRSSMSNDEHSRFDRQSRFRDEGYRRPYTGRFTGSRPFGDDQDRGWSSDRREFSGSRDPHYNEWRQRQMDELDRDYDDYRRENQSRFDNEFSSWRGTRQGKRQLLGQIREHMTVVGSDQEHVGTVDHVRGDHIVLTKNDSEDQRHHRLSCSSIDRIEGDQVILDTPASDAKQRFESEGRGFFREDDRDAGPHILNRSFSGTYER